MRIWLLQNIFKEDIQRLFGSKLLIFAMLNGIMTGWETRAKAVVSETPEDTRLPGPETIPKIVLFPESSENVKGPKFY